MSGLDFGREEDRGKREGDGDEGGERNYVTYIDYII